MVELLDIQQTTPGEVLSRESSSFAVGGEEGEGFDRDGKYDSGSHDSSITSSRLQKQRSSEADDRSTPTLSKPSALKKLVMKLWMNWARVLNRIRLMSEACLDSDEITDGLFDDDDGELSLKKIKSILSPSESKKGAGCSQCKCGGKACGETCDCHQKEELTGLKDTSIPKSLQPTSKRTTLEDKLSLDTSATTSEFTSPKGSINRHNNNTTTESEPTSDPDTSVPLTKEPFIGGEKLWKEQNRAWLTPAPEKTTMQGKLRLMKKQQSQDIRNHVIARDYPIVYRNLVIHNRTLKKPMNLKDLMRVLDVNWNWNRLSEAGAVVPRSRGYPY
ncbi:DEKNAAC105539 [Brettanomyces naardenensis]|uniref:DEKNAAC105539 n=1 Tax=Brettanomyces naardenensis TaxID=13370 RepID=A0A448YU10_BRENA|nr:DEKNAAC105539 [Brettanomyces naardenensis]